MSRNVEMCGQVRNCALPGSFFNGEPLAEFIGLIVLCSCHEHSRECCVAEMDVGRTNMDCFQLVGSQVCDVKA